MKTCSMSFLWAGENWTMAKAQPWTSGGMYNISEKMLDEDSLSPVM